MCRAEICLACGVDMAPSLWESASVRCHDCRNSHAPLQLEFLQQASRSRPFLSVITIAPRAGLQNEGKRRAA